MKRVACVFWIIAVLAVNLVFMNAEAEESINKHKTGTFSDISVQEYVRQIKTGINFMSHENWFNQTWIDVEHIPSLPLPLRVSGMVDTMWTVSPQTVLYQGDEGLIRMPIKLQSPGDGSRAKIGSIGLQIDIPRTIPMADILPNSVVLEIKDAKILTKSGSSFPMDGANGIFEVSFKSNPWGISTAFGHTDFYGALGDLEGAVYEATVRVVEAPQSKATSVYMCDLSNNHYFDLAYFDALKASGFNAVRLAIDWFESIDNETLRIDPDYLNAVERVVDYITNLDMYVIIEMHNDYTPYTPYLPFVGDHHEAAWMLDIYKPYVDKRFQESWLQIAKHFKDYDEYVMFQAQNEPTMVDFSQYGEDNPFESYKEYHDISVRRVDEMNSIFVDAVRSTGGNNAKRFLLFEHYGAMAHSYATSKISIPDDDRLILSVHCYFSEKQNRDGDWVPVQEWRASDREYADTVLAFIGDFTQKTGVPVIIDEVGSTTETPEDIRIKATRYFYQRAKRLGAPCFWWEDSEPGIENGRSFGLEYDLVGKTWSHADLLSSIMDTVYSTSLGTVSITGRSVNLRADASVDSTIIEKAKKGQQFECLAIQDNDWYEIKLDTGETAFVSSQFARLLTD